MSRRFPRASRIRKRREFLSLQSTGRKIHGKHFLVLVATGGTGRVGITVSKKVGNAVKRNRIKRLVREFVRQNPWLPSGCDAVVIAKRSASEVTGLDEVAQDLARLRSRFPPC